MSAQASQSTERFDLNQARVTGVVQRMWSSGPDILLRLLVDGGTEEQSDRLTLMLPDGCIKGQPVTLMKGDRIMVAGHLQDAPYMETGRQFAEKSRKGGKLLEDLPGLAEITSERMATYVVVHDLDFVNTGAAQPVVNEVTVEGVISRVWNRNEQRFVRLAIYDQHTTTTGKAGKNGRPWRQAHYVSVHLVDGQVNGRSINLKAKDRVRIIGRLSERRYSESLGLFLMRTKKIAMLSTAANADDLREVRTPRVATYVQAASLIQFTK